VARGSVKRAAAREPVERLWPLPEGWQWRRLGEVCEPSQYGWTTSAASNGRVKLLRTTDISSGSVDWRTVPFCLKDPENLERYRITSGDILISRAGSVGKSFLIESADEAVFASYLIRFRPLGVPRYIYHWLQTDTYWSMISDNTAGVATPNVNASKLSELPIPMAPEGLRGAVVARIDELLLEIDHGEAALALARNKVSTWRKALLKAAVTGELTADWRARNRPTETGADLLARILGERRARWQADPKTNGRRYVEPVAPDTSNLAELPDGWAWTTVEVAGDVRQGRQRAPAHHSGKNMRPYLRVANVMEGRLDLRDVKEMNFTPAEFDTYALPE
jgi:type I restriction enzyme, S subunit